MSRTQLIKKKINTLPAKGLVETLNAEECERVLRFIERYEDVEDQEFLDAIEPFAQGFQHPTTVIALLLISNLK